MAVKDNLYNRYVSGELEPGTAQIYKKALDAGTMGYPQGITSLPYVKAYDTTVKTAEIKPIVKPIPDFENQTQPEFAPQQPQGYISRGQQAPQAYDRLAEMWKNGELDEQRKDIFERGVKSGQIQLNPGYKDVEALINPLSQPETPEPTVFEDIAKIPGAVKEQITGEERMVPETEALNNITQMPEMNEFTLETLKNVTGTMMTDPKETAQIIKKNSPDVEVRQDEKGNYIFKSAKDGQEYAFKPGFRESDIPRTAAGAVMYTVLAAQGLVAIPAAMGLEIAVQAKQAALGGEFDWEQVALAGFGEGVAKGVGKVASKVKGVFSKTPSKMETLVKEVEQAGVSPTTSDVIEKAAEGSPPKTWAAQVGRQIGDVVPGLGTGPKRAKQQVTRQSMIKDTLEEFGVDEASPFQNLTMENLSKTGKDYIVKNQTKKREVIERLSKEVDEPLEGAMGHRPSESGGTLDDITNKGELMPDDVYTNPEYYADMSDKTYQQSYAAIKKYQGKPNATVTVYRAGPRDELRNGDWITLSKEYAKGEAATEGVPVNSFKVKAKDVQFAGDDINEFGYWGKGVNIEPKNLVNVESTVKAFDDEIAQYKKVGTTESKQAAKILEEYQQAIQGKDLAGVERVRKEFGGKIKDQSEAVKSELDKSYLKLYDVLRTDMGDYIKANGKPRDYAQWRVTNRNLAKMINLKKDTILGSVLNQGKEKPEAIRRLLFSKNPSEIKILYNNLSKEGKRNAKLAVLQEVVEKSGGIEKLSTAKFSTNLDKMSKQTGILFNNKDRQVLKGLEKALNLTKHAEQANFAPRTGERAVPLIIYGALTSWLGGYGGTAAFASLGVAARAYESKAMRWTLLKLAKAKPGREQVLIQQLGKLLQTYKGSQTEKVKKAVDKNLPESIKQKIPDKIRGNR